ncbi:hypothetical protein BCR42DRAFT_377387 [Absidia repens]|uniref:SH3 domain-containing protein n=1 Tax=Absidia repens TaxID=90262 RepID=A0A1X2ICU4_9FUNG|nr:hypothetical protein BCR42DRAFT_377387 [Absidia repens]
MTSAINVSTHPLSAENETLSITKENEYHPYDPQQHHHGIMTSTEEEEDEMTIEEDGSSSMSSSPSIPDENINFDLVYALHTFTATVEGQASVVKGDALILMEDTNIYWWLVEVLKTREIGYIPAENIETPYERLARLNKHRNVEITSPSPDATATTLASSEYTSFTTSSSKRVTIAAEGSLEKINVYEVESDFEGDDELSVGGGDGDDDNFQDAEQQDISTHTGKYQQSLSSTDGLTAPPKLLVHPDDDDLIIQSVNEQQVQIHQVHQQQNVPHGQQQQQQQQQQPHEQQKQKPQQYLTPTAWKRDTSSHSLSSDGSSKHHSLETHSLRVFAGNIGQGPLFHSFDILAMTTTDDLLKEVVKRFDILPTSSDDQNSTIEYYIAVQGADGDDYILASQDKPLSIFKTLTASLTTPMPAVSQNICRKPQEGTGSTRRKRSSSFGNYEQTSYEEDSVIRFYVHRRMKRAHERQGLVYIKVSLYPDDPSSNDHPAGLLEQQQQQQQQHSSTFFFKNKKKKLSAAAIKTEIDRIDKILPVSYDSLVGAVINTALEKFHVPDAEADGMQHQQDQKSHPLDAPPPQSHRHGTTKYYMSVRNASGQETLLQATDIMEDVLHGQQQQVSDHISRDLLFILRQCNSSGRKTRQQPPFPLSNLGKQDRKGSYSSIGSHAGGGGSDERRPSILDILMDSPPRSADDRRPSYKSSPLASPRSFVNDRRRSNHSLGQQQQHQQDRSNSLPSVYEATSPLASTHGLSPPVMSISRSRQSSCSALSTNPPSSDQSDTEQLAFSSSSSSLTNSKHENNISTNSGSDTKKRKESSSFKSQLKRLVGWGSSSSSKLKKVNDLTISTSPSVQSSTITSANQQQQQQQQTITSQSAFVSTGSNFSFSKAEGLQSNISTTSAPAISGAAMSSSTSLPQQALEPLPQQPQQHLQHPMDDGRSASLYMNNNSSTPSVQSSSSPAGQWQQVDSVMMVHDASSHTNSSEQQQDLLPPPVPPKTPNDSHVAHLSTPSAIAMSSNNSELEVSRSSSIIQHNDHDDDDDMISSSSSSDDDYDEPETQGDSNDSDDGVAIVGAVDSDEDDEDDDDESDDPDRPEQRRRLNSVVSIGRNGGTKNASSSSRKGSLAGMTISEHHRNDNNYEPQQQQQQQHPAPAPAAPVAAQDDFDNDLFFLVTQGVDYLKTRECTKWEDEENRYQYHPWNRPQPLNSSTLVGGDGTAATDAALSMTMTTSNTASNIALETPSLDGGSEINNNNNNISSGDDTNGADHDGDVCEPYSDKTLVSPPLSPSNINQPTKNDRSINNKKNPAIPSPSIVTPKDSSVDDEELKWIVNSHILF